MSGKGDTQRPTDHKKYSDNYDLIFGKKSLKNNDKQKNLQEQDKKEQQSQHQRS